MARNTDSPFEYYLDVLGSWSTNIAPAGMWYMQINFDDVQAMLSTLQKQLIDKEGRSGNGWNLSKDVTKYLVDGKLQYANHHIGCVFARSVTNPSESVNVVDNGLNYGGYQGPVITNGREKQGIMEAVFLETNASFLDLVLRPWTILVAYNGLIARNKNSPKYVKASSIDVCQLAKAGPNNPMVIKKIVRYFNVAPVGIQGDTLEYTDQGIKYSTVRFAYDQYVVLEEDTAKMLYA